MKRTCTTQEKPARMTCLSALTKQKDKLGHNHKSKTNIRQCYCNQHGRRPAICLGREKMGFANYQSVCVKKPSTSELQTPSPPGTAGLSPYNQHFLHNARSTMTKVLQLYKVKETQHGPHQHCIHKTHTSHPAMHKKNDTMQAAPM